MGHSRNYCFLAAGDKLRVPANISATLFSQRSTQHSLNISRKSLFEEEFSARVSVFVYYFEFMVQRTEER